MDIPGPSRHRCRDTVPANARNVRRRCPVTDLAAGGDE